MEGLIPRYFWCSGGPLYMAYHDEERDAPQHDSDTLFGPPPLRSFQARLSRIIALKRRKYYHEVLFDSDVQWVAQMNDTEIGELMLDPSTIRNRTELNAAWQDVQTWLELDNPAGSLWFFVDGQPKIGHFAGRAGVLATTPEAEAMSKALCKAGFNFVEPTTCYTFMQASGMIMDHTQNYDRYAQLVDQPSTP